ncbi:MAG: hypothetical protein DMF32_10385, partial [Verrucomicrobia bacterium]
MLYGVLALLFFSGAAWPYWNDLVSSPRGFRDEWKGVGDEGPRRRRDGDFGAYRNASLRSRAFRLAGASESWQWVAVPWH